MDLEEDQSRDHAGYDGYPSSAVFTMMDIHPKLPVMDIHVPSRLIRLMALAFTNTDILENAQSRYLAKADIRYLVCILWSLDFYRVIPKYSRLARDSFWG